MLERAWLKVLCLFRGHNKIMYWEPGDLRTKYTCIRCGKSWKN